MWLHSPAPDLWRRTCAAAGRFYWVCWCWCRFYWGTPTCCLHLCSWHMTHRYLRRSVNDQSTRKSSSRLKSLKWSTLICESQRQLELTPYLHGRSVWTWALGRFHSWSWWGRPEPLDRNCIKSKTVRHSISKLLTGHSNVVFSFPGNPVVTYVLRSTSYVCIRGLSPGVSGSQRYTWNFLILGSGAGAAAVWA